MMRHASFKLAAALALCATAPVQAAATADCINRAEMHGLVAYFLPDVIAKVAEGCSPHLPAESYLRTGLPRLAVPLNQGKAGVWPAAKAAFFKMGKAEDVAAMSALPDEALRPLIDAAITAQLPIKLDAATCADVNEITEALAPLSADQTVRLVATIFSTVARDDKKMRSCPREAQ